MNPVRPVLAWYLLAVFAVGGIAAPEVHRVSEGVHENERRAEHAAHHAGQGHEDGALWSAPCDDGEAHHVLCAVCEGVSSIETDAQPGAMSAVQHLRVESGRRPVWGAPYHGVDIRGPPKA